MSGRPRRTVLFVYNTASYLIRFRSELIREFQGMGCECHAVLPEGIADAERKALSDLGIRVQPVRNFVDQRITPLSDIRLLLEYRALYRRLKPDIVFNFTIKPVIFSGLAARLAGVKTIAAMVTGLGYIFMAENAYKRLLSFVAGLLYRTSLYNRSVVFFQNNDDKNYFLKRGLVTPDQSVLINGSGVDVDTFKPAEKPAGAPVFLMVARLLKDKGVMEYLEAARLAKNALPAAKFVLVGPIDRNPAGITPDLLQPYIDSGVVDYRGHLSDPLTAYHEAAIYVLPSYREGRPRTVLEAMACGLPIITTDVPGCRETIEDGVNGWLVPAKNAAALSAKMIELGRDLALVRKMGAASRRLAEQKYDVRLITAQIRNRIIQACVPPSS